VAIRSEEERISGLGRGTQYRDDAVTPDPPEAAPPPPARSRARRSSKLKHNSPGWRCVCLESPEAGS